MAPRDSLNNAYESSGRGYGGRLSANEVLTRTLLAVKAGGEARRSGPMTTEDLMTLRQAHADFVARMQECHRRIDELATAMKELRIKLDHQIEQASKENSKFKRGKKK